MARGGVGGGNGRRARFTTLWHPKPALRLGPGCLEQEHDVSLDHVAFDGEGKWIKMDVEFTFWKFDAKR